MIVAGQLSALWHSDEAACLSELVIRPGQAAKYLLFAWVSVGFKGRLKVR